MFKIRISKSIKLKSQQSAFISFEYDYAVIKLIKTFADYFYHENIDEWEVPIETTAQLNEVKTLDDLREPSPPKKSIKGVSLSDYEFKTTPRDYQLKGIEYGLKHKKFILGDEQGLGKTLQAANIAAIAKQNHGFKHCLVICGVNTLKDNWYEEIHKHTFEKAHILGTRYKKNGRRYVKDSAAKLEDLNNLSDAYFLVTNVESLRFKVQTGEQFNKRKGKMMPVYSYPITDKLELLVDSGVIGVILFDEFHKCKNVATSQSEQLLRLKPQYRIPMSGTSLVNSPGDLYTPLHWIGKEKHTYYQFCNHFMRKGRFKGQFNGWKHLDQLHNTLKSCQLRRLKKDVIDLPPKIYVDELLEMNPKQLKIYEEVEAAIRKDIDKIRLSNNPLSQMIRLRQATGYTGILSTSVTESVKFEKAYQLLEDICERDEKCIIFSNWTDITNPIYDFLLKFNPAIITGDVKESDRSAMITKFKNKDSCRLMIGTFGAIGVGLTLTEANNVIHLDDPWHKAGKNQAEDRTHRIGTTKPVNIHTLMCVDTIDIRVNGIVENKGDLSDFILDGKIKNRGSFVDYLLGVK